MGGRAQEGFFKANEYLTRMKMLKAAIEGQIFKWTLGQTFEGFTSSFVTAYSRPK